MVNGTSQQMQQRVIFVMGVSGSGKTTIGRMIAQRLGLDFFDGDDYHPVENVSKMKAGQPLDDNDRLPWLTKLHDIAMMHVTEKGCVIACSALKEIYRQVLMSGISDKVTFVFLDGEYQIIEERMLARQGHYMKSSLLKSQFETLQRPEHAICISIDNEPENIVNQILHQLAH